MRGVLFCAVFYSSTAIMAILGLPLLLLPQRVIWWWQRLWARLVMLELRLICGISAKIKGTKPQKQVIYAVKHQSAWETIILPALLDAPVMVMKRTLFYWPVFGFYLMRFGVIAIDRKRNREALHRLLRDSRRAAAEKRNILIFPQGTRLAPDDSRPYHGGVYGICKATGLPVVPVALNSGYFWPRSWWQKHSGEIVVNILPELPPASSRGEWMKRLEHTIEKESQALAPADGSSMKA